MSRVITVRFTDPGMGPLVLPGDVGTILGVPMALAEHVEAELGRRVAAWMDVECGRVEVGETGVGTLRSGVKGDTVHPFRWARITTEKG